MAKAQKKKAAPKKVKAKVAVKPKRKPLPPKKPASQPQRPKSHSAAPTAKGASLPPAGSRTPSSGTPSSEPLRSTQRPLNALPTSTSGIRYLSASDVIELHRAVSAEFGGHQAQPGVVESQFGLTNAVQRPQTTVFGKDAYPTFAEKAAAFLFALLQNMPFRAGNRRVALVALMAFCEVNQKVLDGRIMDEKTFENLIKRTANYRNQGLAPENVFRELREVLSRAIVPLPAS